MNLLAITPRQTFGLIALYTVIMMVTALLYFQMYLQLEPCVLCVAQRIVTISVGMLALIAFVHGKWVRGYASLILAVVACGIFLAVRHLWIQSLPADQVPLCGPSFDYIVDAFPLQEAVEMVMLGDGNCADIKWSFLGLSIPGWTLVAFVALFVAAIYQLFRPLKD